MNPEVDELEAEADAEVEATETEAATEAATEAEARGAFGRERTPGHTIYIYTYM